VNNKVCLPLDGSLSFFFVNIFVDKYFVLFAFFSHLTLITLSCTLVISLKLRAITFLLDSYWEHTFKLNAVITVNSVPEKSSACDS